MSPDETLTPNTETVREAVQEATRKAEQENCESIDRAIAEIDEQIARLPKAESAGRSHVSRERLSRWIAHQVHGDKINPDEGH